MILPYDHGPPFTPQEAYEQVYHGAVERADEAQPGFELWRTHKQRRPNMHIFTDIFFLIAGYGIATIRKALKRL